MVVECTCIVDIASLAIRLTLFTQEHSLSVFGLAILEVG